MRLPAIQTKSRSTPDLVRAKFRSATISVLTPIITWLKSLSTIRLHRVGKECDVERPDPGFVWQPGRNSDTIGIQESCFLMKRERRSHSDLFPWPTKSLNLAPKSGPTALMHGSRSRHLSSASVRTRKLRFAKRFLSKRRRSYWVHPHPDGLVRKMGKAVRYTARHCSNRCARHAILVWVCHSEVRNLEEYLVANIISLSREGARRIHVRQAKPARQD